MRNATVAALIYELFYNYCDVIEGERRRDSIILIPDENGTLREAFNHWFISKWEWSTSILNAAGVIKPLASPTLSVEAERKIDVSSPYYYAVMTLEECRKADFSAFETFDNYCYAMFTFSQFVDDEIYWRQWSSHFTDSVALMDDIFLVHRGTPVKFFFYRDKSIIFCEERFQEKVMRHWRDACVRKFLPKVIE